MTKIDNGLRRPAALASNHRAQSCETLVSAVRASAYVIPTDGPESDGTYEWNQTTLVFVESQAAGERGVGYTYANVATAHLIDEALANVVQGIDAMYIPAAWHSMVHAVRNVGRPGIASMAISAVDASLWDLKAKLLECPLVVESTFEIRHRPCAINIHTSWLLSLPTSGRIKSPNNPRCVKPFNKRPS
jgi:hypothetical protein